LQVLASHLHLEFPFGFLCFSCALEGGEKEGKGIRTLQGQRKKKEMHTLEKRAKEGNEQRSILGVEEREEGGGGGREGRAGCREGGGSGARRGRQAGQGGGGGRVEGGRDSQELEAVF